jgi:hypothetical protein
MEKNIILVITGLLFLMSVPAAPGRSLPATDTPAERAKSIHTLELNLDSIFLAENESEASESVSQSSNENKEQPSESGAAARENSSNSANDTETKAIKPFKPSEEIAAEQAVDFPVDI